MRPGSVWLALDSGFCHATDIVNLGEDFGAEGKLAVIALFCACKAQEGLHDEPDVVVKKWRGFRRAACISDLDKAKDIVAAIAQEGIIEILESDENGFRARIPQWATWQKTARNRMKSQRYRDGNAKSPSVTHGNARSPQGNDRSLEESRREEKKKTLVREDIELLCSLLAEQIHLNGSKRPAVTDRWRAECRLLLDRDGRAQAEVEAVIRWCQADSFWKTNILSMPKLRAKYDQLRLRMESEGVSKNEDKRAAKVYDLRTTCRTCDRQLSVAERSSGWCDECFEKRAEQATGGGDAA